MRKVFLTLYLSIISLTCFAADTFVVFTPEPHHFPLITKGAPCSIVMDTAEDEGVKMAISNLQQDIRQVCNNQPALLNNIPAKRCVIIGNYHSAIIQKLIAAGKIDKEQLINKNEKFLLQVIAKPADGVDEALVIAGSDKRGTIYGIYELSKQMGVSPWYWWADVPVIQQENVYIKPGIYTDGEPKVEYRGIFINDEWPSFGNWAKAKFGGINSKVYKHVFELVLRLKGNFVWPAMWGSAFYDDDPQNGQLANTMGIVMGTSHHEPMALAQQDWKRRGKGEWDYNHNAQNLRDFWTYGIERAKNWESVITVGMRGDGDEPMSEGANISLLENIVKDQRKIIEKVTGKKAKETPQVWALYKEVQEYYDKGMRVPDDITLLLCDDNWGNVRKLPNLNEKPRSGGYGMYYHFDYVGAPRNSKWININPIPRIWEQMNLTYEYGVRKLWIVNVGDLKPMEYPITFFLDMAWNPEKFNAQNLQQHTENFCAQLFGSQYAKEAARILSLYAKYNRRVTPETLNAKTYSFNYGEWERVVDEYNALALDAHNLGFLLPATYRDTYDQIISYPVQACSNLYNMYYAQAKNHALAAKLDPEANQWADKVESCYLRDSLLSHYYNKVISNGKWNHMMDQIHIGYTSWNNPQKQIMPKVIRVPEKEKTYTFQEIDGYVAMEAEHFTRAIAEGETSWSIIPDFGKTLSGVTTIPVTKTPEKMYLEYDIEMKKTGKVRVELLLAPTLNFNDNKGLSYAISFDGEKEQIINFNGHYKGGLGKWQANPIIESRSIHQLDKKGKHTLRIRPLNPGIVIEKIMIHAGGLKTSYLGAPETCK
ncbi:glycosyl hydrolase 115 family protein [Bacteroides zhangwenhongii]|uniref:Glycosyl hydrolase 115 family protein n=1 Tax=Bacteroides zhangwenhongii TaxID=2650157 RepID=A0ABT5HEI5_9BACE|nr:glycosyl hydrolase 115 family protein [Bacteroides zhangwenhongii]MDC7138725.1 glycosyl hydrolase 115 family protein [Bacteroides zhangwenhongii]